MVTQDFPVPTLQQPQHTLHLAHNLPFSAMEIEDSEDLHVPFIKKDWIQTGKLYNVSTIPLYIILEKNECMAMPNNFCINPHFPLPIIPVTQFVA